MANNIKRTKFRSAIFLMIMLICLAISGFFRYQDKNNNQNTFFLIFYCAAAFFGIINFIFVMLARKKEKS